MFEDLISRLEAQLAYLESLFSLCGSREGANNYFVRKHPSISLQLSREDLIRNLEYVIDWLKSPANQAVSVEHFTKSTALRLQRKQIHSWMVTALICEVPKATGTEFNCFLLPKSRTALDRSIRHSKKCGTEKRVWPAFQVDAHVIPKPAVIQAEVESDAIESLPYLKVADISISEEITQAKFPFYTPPDGQHPFCHKVAFKSTVVHQNIHPDYWRAEPSPDNNFFLEAKKLQPIKYLLARYNVRLVPGGTVTSLTDFSHLHENPLLSQYVNPTESPIDLSKLEEKIRWARETFYRSTAPGLIFFNKVAGLDSDDSPYQVFGVNDFIKVGAHNPSSEMSSLQYKISYLSPWHGRHLGEFIQANINGTNPLLSSEKQLSLLRQLFNAAATFHAAGIVHQDLKLENIMVKPSSNGEDYVVTIIDTGLSEGTDGTLSQDYVKMDLSNSTIRICSPEIGFANHCHQANGLSQDKYEALKSKHFCGLSYKQGLYFLQTPILNEFHHEKRRVYYYPFELPTQFNASFYPDALSSKPYTIRPGQLSKATIASIVPNQSANQANDLWALGLICACLLANRTSSDLELSLFKNHFFITDEMTRAWTGLTSNYWQSQTPEYRAASKPIFKTLQLINSEFHEIVEHIGASGIDVTTHYPYLELFNLKAQQLSDCMMQKVTETTPRGFHSPGVEQPRGTTYDALEALLGLTNNVMAIVYTLVCEQVDMVLAALSKPPCQRDDIAEELRARMAPIKLYQASGTDTLANCFDKYCIELGLLNAYITNFKLDDAPDGTRVYFEYLKKTLNSFNWYQFSFTHCIRFLTDIENGLRFGHIESWITKALKPYPKLHALLSVIPANRPSAAEVVTEIDKLLGELSLKTTPIGSVAVENVPTLTTLPRPFLPLAMLRTGGQAVDADLGDAAAAAYPKVPPVTPHSRTDSALSFNLLGPSPSMPRPAAPRARVPGKSKLD